jgi:hypothetical protein
MPTSGVENLQPAPSLQKRYWTVGKILGLVLGLIIILGIAGFAFSQYRNAQNGAAPLQVTVSGTAKTGFSSTVVRVEFAQYQQSIYSGSCSQYVYANSCYTSSHSAGVNSGAYSTVLDARSSWTVFLIYDNYYMNGYYYNSQSYCYAGTVNIDSLSGTFTYDVAC